MSGVTKAKTPLHDAALSGHEDAAGLLWPKELTDVNAPERRSNGCDAFALRRPWGT